MDIGARFLRTVHVKGCRQTKEAASSPHCVTNENLTDRLECCEAFFLIHCCFPQRAFVHIVVFSVVRNLMLRGCCGEDYAFDTVMPRTFCCYCCASKRAIRRSCCISFFTCCIACWMSSGEAWSEAMPLHRCLFSLILVVVTLRNGCSCATGLFCFTASGTPLYDL